MGLSYKICLGEVISEEYVLEYGTDCLQMHIGAVQAGDRALVVDDLIATGGTLCAAIKLLGKCYRNMNYYWVCVIGTLEFMQYFQLLAK